MKPFSVIGVVTVILPSNRLSGPGTVISVAPVYVTSRFGMPLLSVGSRPVGTGPTRGWAVDQSELGGTAASGAHTALVTPARSYTTKKSFVFITPRRSRVTS